MRILIECEKGLTWSERVCDAFELLEDHTHSSAVLAARIQAQPTCNVNVISLSHLTN